MSDPHTHPEGPSDALRSEIARTDDGQVRPDGRVDSPRIEIVRANHAQLRLLLAGHWRMDADLSALDRLDVALQEMPRPASIAFDSSALIAWDSSLISHLAILIWRARERGIQVDETGLPQGMRALLRLAATTPALPRAARAQPPASLLPRVGLRVVELTRASGAILAFIGEVTLALPRMLTGRARFRRVELWALIEEVGAAALPIVSLVSLLVGLILGYIGDQQLAQFGARIFVADLVGLAIVIQMGALITAIVLAGRTSAAFAAQLGTMQVNEEIDALRTLGISPIEFLVLPRLVALVVMTPLLAIYANLMGILGGALAGSVVGGLSLTEYFTQTINAIRLNHVAQGLISATVYGAIVAVSGCLRGMQGGRDAAAVGQATTSAVVTSIVFIVIAAALLTIVFDAVGLS
ncbi:MAG: ABC transporter permease [Sphingobacteriia bacterium]|nr:ABC transporter permease [Sphingobacteriia bacterium]NCC41096.1 ABC transporter permease [Gammaproteobacteria bacterium]